MARPIIPMFDGGMRLSDLAADCLKSYAGDHTLQDNTRANYDRTYSQLVAFLRMGGALDDVRSFTKDNARAFKDYLLERGIKPSTVRNKLSALRTLARYAHGRENARGRPMVAEDVLKFEWPKKPRAETAFLYPGELAAFRAVQRPQAEALARELFIDTGQRASAIANADVVDFIDGARPMLRLVVKGGYTELVPLSQGVAEAVRDYLRRREPQPREPLLLNTLGARYSRQAISELMYRIGQAAGIRRFRMSAHKLRHTANVVARVSTDLDPVQRSKLLGHRSLRSLEIYEHLLPGELHGAQDEYRRGVERYCDSGIAMPAPEAPPEDETPRK